MNNLMNRKKNQKGFTLMEMLIVVAIIAVLVAILIPTVSASLNKSKEATDIANLRAAYAETQMKYLANPDATLTFTVPKLNYQGTGSDGTTTNVTGFLVKNATTSDLDSTKTDTENLPKRQATYIAVETGKEYSIQIGANGYFKDSAWTKP